jgi:hypothetical protein
MRTSVWGLNEPTGVTFPRRAVETGQRCRSMPSTTNVIFCSDRLTWATTLATTGPAMSAFTGATLRMAALQGGHEQDNTIHRTARNRRAALGRIGVGACLPGRGASAVDRLSAR